MISRFGSVAASWMLAAPRIGPEYRCGTIWHPEASAIAAIFFPASSPPQRPRFGCQIAAA